MYGFSNVEMVAEVEMGTKHSEGCKSKQGLYPKQIASFSTARLGSFMSV